MPPLNRDHSRTLNELSKFAAINKIAASSTAAEFRNKQNLENMEDYNPSEDEDVGEYQKQDLETNRDIDSSFHSQKSSHTG